MRQFMFTLVLIVLVSAGINAQEFHPYKVKSGKIIFEKRKYSMRATVRIDANDKVTGSRSNPSYVKEEVTYYWDNYGDVAYEVAYQISAFG